MLHKNKTNVFARTIIILIILAFNISCDQVSKSIVRKKFTDYTQIHFFSNHVNLIKVENSGAFLSIGNSLHGPSRIILLNLLPMIAVLAGLIFILFRTNLNKVILLAVIMITGGGIGNLYDRVVHGSVTDFMHINFVLFQTGIFNVADMSIMAGMFMLILHAWFGMKDEEELNNTSTEI